MSNVPACADPQQVLELLRSCETGLAADRVEQVETHISWVFLTQDFAYKLKKPVRFEFLDFSTAELRRQACEDEVRLNRRLAADVYLGVVPIHADPQRAMKLDGEGPPIDWLVKMRRLPAQRSLDRLIQSGSITDAEVERIANLLCRFFAQATPASIGAEQFVRAIQQHVRANADELQRPEHRLDAALVQRVCGVHLRWLLLRGDLLAARVNQRRVIEGHGDLRPEHVYIENGAPSVIDCIEFSRDLRTLDVADELSFLAMECDRLGAEAIGQRLIELYEEQSGDRPPAPLWAFYKSYRACVRAKVAALRSVQQTPQQRSATLAECRAYLELADRYARRALPPLLIVVRGLMGTGKSTLAAALAESLGMETLSTDAIRRELFPASQQPAAYGKETYTADSRGRVYEEMFDRTRQRLAEGASVILDGTFLSNELRRRAVEIGQQAKAVTLIVTCVCPADVAAERIRSRHAAGASLSEARPELLAMQQQDDEPRAEDLPQVTVDTTLAITDQEKRVSDRLNGALRPPTPPARPPQPFP